MKNLIKQYWPLATLCVALTTGIFLVNPKTNALGHAGGDRVQQFFAELAQFEEEKMIIDTFLNADQIDTTILSAEVAALPQATAAPTVAPASTSTPTRVPTKSAFPTVTPKGLATNSATKTPLPTATTAVKTYPSKVPTIPLTATPLKVVKATATPAAPPAVVQAAPAAAEQADQDQGANTPPDDLESDPQPQDDILEPTPSAREGTPPQLSTPAADDGVVTKPETEKQVKKHKSVNKKKNKKKKKV